jgi:hypothetical protein
VIAFCLSKEVCLLEETMSNSYTTITSQITAIYGMLSNARLRNAYLFATFCLKKSLVRVLYSLIAASRLCR